VVAAAKHVVVVKPAPMAYVSFLVHQDKPTVVVLVSISKRIVNIAALAASYVEMVKFVSMDLANCLVKLD